MTVKEAFELAVLGKCLDYEKKTVMDTVNRFFQEGEGLAFYEAEAEAERKRLEDMKNGVGKIDLNDQSASAKAFRLAKDESYKKMVRDAEQAGFQISNTLTSDFPEPAIELNA
jgi:hypothetical protein